MLRNAKTLAVSNGPLPRLRGDTVRHADRRPFRERGAAGTSEGDLGFHPLLVYGDETDEALAGELRVGNAPTGKSPIIMIASTQR